MTYNNNNKTTNFMVCYKKEYSVITCIIQLSLKTAFLLDPLQKIQRVAIDLQRQQNVRL